MIISSFGLAAVYAVAVHALVLPPGSDYNELLNPLVDPKARIIQIPCSTCYAASDDDLERHNQVWMHSSYEINVNFGVSYDGERLEINGEAVYPPHLHRENYFRGHPIHVNQVSSSGLVTPLEITSSALRVVAERPISDNGDVIVVLKFQIMALDGQYLAGLPGIVVDLLKTSNGELFIVTVYASESDSYPASTRPEQATRSIDDKECHMLPSLICQLHQLLRKTIAAVRWGKFRSSSPCKYRHRWTDGSQTYVQSSPLQVAKAHEAHKYLDQWHNTSLNLDHPDQRRHYVHEFVRSMIAVLIPILSGITVGLFISFIGLVVGRILGWFWINLIRGQHRRRASVSVDTTNYYRTKILVEEETDILPVYEDAPAYEEIDPEPR